MSTHEGAVLVRADDLRAIEDEQAREVNARNRCRRLLGGRRAIRGVMFCNGDGHGHLPVTFIDLQRPAYSHFVVRTGGKRTLLQHRERLDLGARPSLIRQAFVRASQRLWLGSPRPSLGSRQLSFAVREARTHRRAPWVNRETPSIGPALTALAFVELEFPRDDSSSAVVRLSHVSKLTAFGP